MDGQSEYNRIREKVYKILYEVTGVKEDQIDEQSPWYDLEAESFELVEFIVALRDEFKISITTKDLARVKNLSDIIQIVYKSHEKGS